MRVAIDSGPLTSGHKVRGVGAYTKELISVLEQESGRKRKRKVTKLQSYRDIEISPVDFQKTDLSKYDILHYTYFHPFQKTLSDKFNPDQKTVVTIHDVIQLIYPKIFQSGFKGKVTFWKQKRRLKKVEAIIVPSETSKKDVVRFLDVDPEKVYVVYEGVKSVYKKITSKNELQKVKKKYSLPDKFVLYVGDVNYNKNIPTLIKACLKTKTHLVICGKQAIDVADAGINLMSLEGPRDYIRFLFDMPHPELKHYSELYDEFTNNEKYVHRLGFVPDKDLVAVFNLASVYVQPSFYEGFGLPVLEAFACQVPVIVSKTNCLVEVAGNAAPNFDPRSADDLASLITKVIKNRNDSRELVEVGSKRLKDFSWEKAGLETIRIYEMVGKK